MNRTHSTSEPFGCNDPRAAVQTDLDAASVAERRGRSDRRDRLWWSLLYGNYKPRRRRPSRRLDEPRYQSLDWHSSHLLAVSIGIVLLSAADAFLTVTLLAGGAVEINPVMAAVIQQSAGLFAGVKMALTGCGVMLLVVLARYRFMRLVRVDIAMYVLLAGYLTLLSYEFWMLQDVVPPIDL